jgi:hypothetical protein
MNCFSINQNIKTTTWRETLLTLPKNDLCRKDTNYFIMSLSSLVKTSKVPPVPKILRI